LRQSARAQLIAGTKINACSSTAAGVLLSIKAAACFSTNSGSDASSSSAIFESRCRRGWTRSSEARCPARPTWCQRAFPMKRAPTSAGALAQSPRCQHSPGKLRATLPDPQHRQGHAAAAARAWRQGEGARRATWPRTPRAGGATTGCVTADGHGSPSGGYQGVGRELCRFTLMEVRKAW
jgi:hypothetical protein